MYLFQLHFTVFGNQKLNFLGQKNLSLAITERRMSRFVLGLIWFCLCFFPKWHWSLYSTFDFKIVSLAFCVVRLDMVRKCRWKYVVNVVGIISTQLADPGVVTPSLSCDVMWSVFYCFVNFNVMIFALETSLRNINWSTQVKYNQSFQIWEFLRT